ncbi:MAG TPA: aldo/keto reductase [Stellaceae bacterium]|nr:aldo/keto reductase [Stellaceae bacterium]
MLFVTVKGTKVPALGFGTWQLNGAQCESAVEHALATGYRHIDTAQAYANEREVGRAIARSGVKRDAIFLTTKIAVDRLAAKDVTSSLAGSLDALGTDHVDLLLIHWPSATVKMGETLRAMNEAKAQGRIRHIGVSNFTVAQMREAIETHGSEIFCNQVEYHVLLAQSRVLAFARAHDIMVTAYCPLARGRIADQPELIAIAKNHGKSVAQVALRWLIQQDGVAAIPRSSKREHIAANFALFDFALTGEEMAVIDRLRGNTRVVSPSFAPTWDPPG